MKAPASEGRALPADKEPGMRMNDGAPTTSKEESMDCKSESRIKHGLKRGVQSIRVNGFRFVQYEGATFEDGKGPSTPSFIRIPGSLSTGRALPSDAGAFILLSVTSGAFVISNGSCLLTHGNNSSASLSVAPHTHVLFDINMSLIPEQQKEEASPKRT
nr:DWNN domain-containing protein [Tanacetum cinerariifolium]